MTQVKCIENKLNEYEGLMAGNTEPYDSAGVARLAQAQQLQAATDSAHIAQAFDEAAIYMGVFGNCTSHDIESYLIQCGYEAHIVRFIMGAFDEFLQGDQA